MSDLRVLHVIAGIAPRYGGPSRAVLGMCGALERCGVDSLIATTDADGQGRLAVSLGELQRYEGASTIFFRRQGGEGFKYSRPLEQWLRGNVGNCDIVEVHGVFSHSSLAAAAACRMVGVPYTVRPLGSLAPWSLKRKSLRKRVLWHLGVKRMLECAAAIHYTTSEERRRAEVIPGLAPGVVVSLGVGQEVLEAERKPGSFRRRYARLAEAPFVLTLGRLHPVKGLELFLSVFLEVTRIGEFGQWRLVVSGEGEAGYVAGLRQLVRRLGGEDRVLFTGWLGVDEKVGALHDAALLALPSHQENFGLSAVESMACGTPVLVSTEVNVADVIAAERAGWVSRLDRQALSEALTEAMGREEEREARGVAARRVVRARFTWPALAREMIQLYESVGRRAPHERSA